jgi:hypothetical protein
MTDDLDVKTAMRNGDVAALRSCLGKQRWHAYAPTALRLGHVVDGADDPILMNSSLPRYGKEGERLRLDAL